MINSDVLSIIVGAAAVVWAIFQTYAVHRLNIQMTQLSTQLDERVKRLHRARELVAQEQASHSFLRFYREALGDENGDIKFQATEHAKMMAAKAELKGLANAIGDKALLNVVNEGMNFTGDMFLDEVTIRGYAQQLHTRIAELLEAETTKRGK